jgi:uncharacterized damage-inducible protein DinB
MAENDNDPSQHYLDSAKAEFKKLKALGDKSFAQLNDADFHIKPDAESNSIALIIQHLSGNMISRWTDFLTTDGEKPSRNRDKEFEENIQSKETLLNQWEQGWQVFTNTLDSLTGADMMKEITIRGEKHSVIQAINHQLTHYGYHIGQIVYLAKHIRSADWHTLSIAKNRSDEFNQKMKERSS